MRIVYIAGPFRAETAWKVEENVRAAERVALRVWQSGAPALCPHTNTRHFQGEADDSLFLAGTMAMLRRCDAVVMVCGWENSEGATAEKAEAELLGLPVFYDSDLGAFRDWLAWDGIDQCAM